jgi:hypothetical protein
MRSKGVKMRERKRERSKGDIDALTILMTLSATT